MKYDCDDAATNPENLCSSAVLDNVVKSIMVWQADKLAQQSRDGEQKTHRRPSKFGIRVLVPNFKAVSG